MNARSTNALLIIVAVIAVAGWAFALTGGLPNLYSWSIEQQRIDAEQTIMEKEAERLRTTVYYGYYNVGNNIPCIMTEAGATPSIDVYAENTHAKDAVIDVTLTAKNADVSLEPSDGFQQSATKRLTVLENTESLLQTFYVKPHPNVDQIQLSLNATAIDPPNIHLTYTLTSSSTVVFSNDGSGKYCQE